MRNWIETICEDYEIEKDDVSKLMSMNGKGLNKLREKDWIRRSPEQGEVLFLMWNDLKEEWSNNQTNKKEETKTGMYSCILFLLLMYVVAGFYYFAVTDVHMGARFARL